MSHASERPAAGRFFRPRAFPGRIGRPCARSTSDSACRSCARQLKAAGWVAARATAIWFVGACLAIGIALPARADTFWVTTLEAVLGLDPDTLEIKKSIPLPRELAGGLNFLPAPDNRTAYVLSGGREVLSRVDLKEGKVLASFSLSERMGDDPGSPRVARARFFGLALDATGKRILGNVVTSRLSGANPAQLERLTLDRPYLAVLDAQTGNRLATITDVPWAISYVAPMQDPAHPNRFLIISPDLDIIDLDRLPPGKAPVRVSFDKVRVKHVPVREASVAGQGPLVILVEWFHPEPSRGLGSMPYYTTDPIVKRDQIGIITVDMSTGAVDELELAPPQGPQLAFATVVSPDRKKCYTIFNQLHEVDLEKRRLTRIRNLPYTYYAGNMSPDGKRLYLFSGGARLAVVDPASLEIVRETILPSEAWDGFILPD